jgi:hypothetical protein
MRIKDEKSILCDVPKKCGTRTSLTDPNDMLAQDVMVPLAQM